MDPSPENAPCWHDQYRPREICLLCHYGGLKMANFLPPLLIYGPIKAPEDPTQDPCQKVEWDLGSVD